MPGLARLSAAWTGTARQAWLGESRMGTMMSGCVWLARSGTVRGGGINPVPPHFQEGGKRAG
jgi:hypothetical protein